jgi:hypothetical protein
MNSKELVKALEAIYAALNQNHTFPADIAYAKRIAEYTLARYKTEQWLDSANIRNLQAEVR